MFILAALSLGFLGSFHCIGMCGPIALSIPIKRTSFFNVLSGSLVYNFGRIITYTLMGLLFGILGQGFVLAGWQNILSITLGTCILLLLLVPNSKIFSTQKGWLFSLLSNLKSHIRRLFGIYSMKSLLLIGILNGLLPCGLVYLGIAGAMATGNAIKGSLFMAIFGLGTFPAMMAVSAARNYITIRFREKVRQMVPVLVGIMALFLILRGMNLGIPFISPSIETNNGMCHHQCCNK